MLKLHNQICLVKRGTSARVSYPSRKTSPSAFVIQPFLVKAYGTLGNAFMESQQLIHSNPIETLAPVLSLGAATKFADQRMSIAPLVALLLELISLSRRSDQWQTITIMEMNLKQLIYCSLLHSLRWALPNRTFR